MNVKKLLQSAVTGLAELQTLLSGNADESGHLFDAASRIDTAVDLVEEGLDSA